MAALGGLLILFLKIYVYVIIASALTSWLVVFGVLDMKNPHAIKFVDSLNKATDPIMKPIQKYVPAINGIDISPIIAILGIMALQMVVGIVFF